jgi:hypothetical protein
MTGSKMTSMTTIEMRAARDRGEDKSDVALIRHNARAGIEPVDDEDSPDASVLMREPEFNRYQKAPLIII